MGQIIESPASVCVCLSVCLSSLLRSQFSLNFDETSRRRVDWNPKSKIEFVGGGVKIRPFFPLFSPIFYLRNALSVARSELHSFEPCGQIVAFDSSKDASRRPLYWQGRHANKSCVCVCGGGAPAPFALFLSLSFIPPFPPSPPSTCPFCSLSSLPLPLNLVSSSNDL